MANLRLIQFKDAKGGRAVGLVTEDGKSVRPLQGYDTVYRLAQAAIDQGRVLAELVKSAASDKMFQRLNTGGDPPCPPINGRC